MYLDHSEVEGKIEAWGESPPGIRSSSLEPHPRDRRLSPGELWVIPRSVINRCRWP